MALNSFIPGDDTKPPPNDGTDGWDYWQDRYGYNLPNQFMNDLTSRFYWDQDTKSWKIIPGQASTGVGLPTPSKVAKVPNVGTGPGAGSVGGRGMDWYQLGSAAMNAYSSYKNSKAQNDAAKNQADLYNNWLKQYTDTGRDLYGQAQASGWNPFGPKVSTNTNTSSFSNRGGSQFSNKPTITQEYQPLDQLMRGIMTGRLGGGSSLPAGYASNAARGINESFEGADTAARNMAARRGLSGEQSYAVASPVSRARAGALADMRGNLPLLERQMQNEDIGITKGLQSAFGTGQSGQSQNWQSGTSQSAGTNTMPFTANDLSAIMGILMPPGPQQSGMTGNSTAGSVVDSLGALMGYLASQQGRNNSGGGGGGGGGINYGNLRGEGGLY